MRTKVHTLFIMTALLVILPLRGEGAFTNQDVVKMVSAHLSESLIIAKIREAPHVEFALEVDDLVALQKAGVSEKTIQVMLERKSNSIWPPQSPSPSGSSPVLNPWASMQEDLGVPELVKVALRNNNETVRIRILRGDVSTAGFAGIGATFMNYPGLHAQARTHERRPSILVKSSDPLTGGNFFLVKLDVDDKNGVRSLKISSMKSGLKAMFGRSRGLIAPDPDWTIPFDSVEESSGIWKVSAKTDLSPGEYGWYVDLGSSSAQASGIFSFGVD